MSYKEHNLDLLPKWSIFGWIWIIVLNFILTKFRMFSTTKKKRGKSNVTMMKIKNLCWFYLLNAIIAQHITLMFMKHKEMCSVNNVVIFVFLVDLTNYQSKKYWDSFQTTKKWIKHIWKNKLFTKGLLQLIKNWTQKDLISQCLIWHQKPKEQDHSI